MRIWLLALVIATSALLPRVESLSLGTKSRAGTADWYRGLSDWVASDIAVDAKGWAYVAGHTTSPNFATTADAYDRTCGTDGACNRGRFPIFLVEADATFAVFDEAGTVRYATYLGGGRSEENTQVSLADDGTIWIGGTTHSTDFDGQPEVSACDGFSVWVARFDREFLALRDFQCIGGRASDSLKDLAAAGNSAWLVGVTNSPDFPVRNAYQPVLAGAGDWFALRVTQGQSGPAVSTFIGGSHLDVVHSLAVSADGDVIMTGYTGSTDFPVVRAAQPASKDVGVIRSEGVVVSLESSGRFLRFATYLGGHGYDSGRVTAADASNNIYVAGRTTSRDFPVTENSYDPFCGADGECDPAANRGFPLNDAFITKLDRNGLLLASTFLGGSGDDEITGIFIQSDEAVMVAGGTQSKDFPLASSLSSRWVPERQRPMPFATRLDVNLRELEWSTLIPVPDQPSSFESRFSAFGEWIYLAGEVQLPRSGFLNVLLRMSIATSRQ